MEEIEANDFNLNISRYVSTAAGSRDRPGGDSRRVSSIEHKIQDATKKHNEFLQRVGFSPASARG